ncbi:predicted protein [Chaetoceros tenuissimus]|uniref:Uncharacterized protein n=1 Tax=Chaetoceros tenuissimus TaxID=426638 RepID=A0AAD3DD17_9STRA|nr:predicted protein [Chaetoceros tenuissimus]
MKKYLYPSLTRGGISNSTKGGFSKVFSTSILIFGPKLSEEFFAEEILWTIVDSSAVSYQHPGRVLTTCTAITWQEEHGQHHVDHTNAGKGFFSGSDKETEAFSLMLTSLKAENTNIIDASCSRPPLGQGQAKETRGALHLNSAAIRSMLLYCEAHLHYLHIRDAI